MLADSLTVIVVNYGSSGLLARNLVAVQDELPAAHIIVVDNFSSAPERAAVESLSRERGWQLLSMRENRGFGGGVNAGALAAFNAGATDVLLLNPDATIDAASVAALAEAVWNAGGNAIASPVVKDIDGHVWFDGADLYLSDGATRSSRRREFHPGEAVVEWISGACMWVPRKVWERSGGFDEDYFLYWEDVDFSRRAADAGAALLVVRGAEAIHDEGGTQRAGGSAGEAKSETYYYYNIRNRLIFAAKRLAPEDVARWSTSARRAAIAVLRRGGTRQFIRPLKPLRSAWRGVRDGRRESKMIVRQ